MFMSVYPMPPLQKTATINHFLQFPKTRSYSTNEMNDIPLWYQDIPGEKLCAFIEGNIFTIISRDILLAGGTKSNSFDPVYLCDLKPDMINSDNLNKIKSFALQIVDKSEEIFFDDGMDD